MRPTSLRAMTLLAAVFSVTFASPSVAPAQSSPETGAHDERLQVGQSVRTPEAGTDIVRANELIGRSVTGADGKVLGLVSNFRFSLSGGIQHLIVTSGGFLGVGGRQVAIPWSQAETRPGSDEIRVTLTRDDFENAPEYEPAERDDALADADD